MEKLCRSAIIFHRLPRIRYLNLRLNSTAPSTIAATASASTSPASTTITAATTTTATTNVVSPAISTTTTTSDMEFLNSGEMKWQALTDLAASDPVLTSAIIPFASQNLIQNILFLYNYPLMYYVDFLSGCLPWWVAIVAATSTIRLLFFPLVVKQNKMGIRISNVLPQTQKLQVKMNEASAQGDKHRLALETAKLKLLYKEHNITIRERLMPVFIQSPMFVSMFLLLRRLSFESMESLKTGGAFWFTDLTIPDPYFVLPLITCTTLFLTLEYGLEGTSGPMKSVGPSFRWFMRGLPVVMFAIVHSYPAAVLLFWSTNNIFTLSYAVVLRNPSVKRMLNIPLAITHDPKSLPMANMTFKSQMKQAMDKSRATKTSDDIRRLDDIAFKKAGIEPLTKTYKIQPAAKSEHRKIN